MTARGAAVADSAGELEAAPHAPCRDRARRHATAKALTLLCAAAATAALLACYYSFGAAGSGLRGGWELVRRYDVGALNFSDPGTDYRCTCSNALLDYRSFVVPVLNVNASSGAAALCDDMCAVDVANQTNPLYPQWQFCRALIRKIRGTFQPCDEAAGLVSPRLLGPQQLNDTIRARVMESALDIYIIIRSQAIAAATRAGPVCDSNGVYVFLDDSRYQYSSTCDPGARPELTQDLDGIGSSGDTVYDASGVLQSLAHGRKKRRLQQWVSPNASVPAPASHVALRTSISNLDAFYAGAIMQGFVPNLFNASHSRGYFQVYWQSYAAACAPLYCDLTVPKQRASSLGDAVQVLATVGGLWALMRLVFGDVLLPLGCALVTACSREGWRAAPKGEAEMAGRRGLH